MSTATEPISTPLSNATFTLLPSEDLKAFHAAQECYKERFQPQDHHEYFLVHLMVQSTWKLARIHRIEAALFKLALDPDAVPATPESAIALSMLKSDPHALSTLERLAATAERTYFKAIRELERGRTAQTPPNPEPVAFAAPIKPPPARPNPPPNRVLPNEANSAPSAPSEPAIKYDAVNRS